MTVKVNSPAITNAKRAIQSGNIDNGSWNGSSLSIDDKKKWCLLMDDSKDPENLGTYSYPVGSGSKLSAKGLASALGYSKGPNGNSIAASQATMLDTLLKKQSVNNSMTKKEPFILLNNESHVYRVLTQTSNELPAYDMGYDHIQFEADAIQKGLNKLVGTFVYDETQSQHNKRVNPEMRGRKVAKIVNEGYCPDYGAYTDWEIFDPEFEETIRQALDNIERGLPVHEGPSTELFANDGVKYGDNNLRVTDLTYNGLVWTDNPRDSSLGVCSVVNNSILNIKEDEIVPEEIEVDIVKLSKEDYDNIKTELEEFETLKTKYSEGETLYTKGKALFDELKTEVEDLKTQLLPVWTKQGEQKAEMVNSLLERIPEAEKEDKKAVFESMDITQLGTIINTLPVEEPERGVQNGGVGSGRKPAKEDPIFEDPDKQAEYEAFQKLPSANRRRNIFNKEE